MLIPHRNPQFVRAGPPSGHGARNMEELAKSHVFFCPLFVHILFTSCSHPVHILYPRFVFRGTQKHSPAVSAPLIPAGRLPAMLAGRDWLILTAGSRFLPPPEAGSPCSETTENTALSAK